MTPASAASLVASAYGLFAGLAALGSTRKLGPALAVGVELLTAAGLLRLSVDGSWDAIGGAAAVVLVRKLVASAFLASGPAEPA